MNNSKKIKLLSIIFLVLIIKNSSATANSIDEFKEYSNDPTALRLAMQFCLPNKTAFFDDVIVDITDMPMDIPFQELAKMYKSASATGKYYNPYRSNEAAREYEMLKQWRLPDSASDYPFNFIRPGKVSDVKGVISDDVDIGYIADTTQKNQPVYFWFSYQRPVDIKAIHITVQVERDGENQWRKFWFKPPKIDKTADYTKWISPFLEEENHHEKGALPVFWLLTHGQDIPPHAVGENAPRVRYLLLSNQEERVLAEAGRRGKNSLGLLHLVEGHPADIDRLHFLLDSDKKSAACD